MKLINKISRYFFISATIIFIIVAASLYIVIEKTIVIETDEQLTNIYQKVVNELSEGKHVNFPPLVEVYETDSQKIEKGFKDVLLDSGEENESEPFRQYSTTVNIHGKYYVIIVRSSLLEKEDMIFSILSVSIGAVFLFFIAMSLMNKFSAQKVFKDFYSTLKKLDNFSIAQNDNLNFEKTNIYEFDKLNKTLLLLSDKARTEYRNLKEFTEETNHELQTPVAVVKSKLEILLQSGNLKESELKLVDTALNNLNRLQRISKSILLLNKLEHKNLFEDSEINISQEINNITSSFTDSITEKRINLNTVLDKNTIVNAKQSLINILLSNLISNSIKHNVYKGSIDIKLTGFQLIISNGGLKPISDTNKFFKRFYKESNSSESIGLGLTIVKKICDLYKIKIEIDYKNEYHTVTINFENAGLIK
ncbi:MAG: HAMP domain-containing sensor histidine kinase [Ignavibacteriota bacterium]